MSRLSKLPLERDSSSHPSVAIQLAQVDQTALYDVGRIFTQEDGKAFVYLKGVASCVVGSVVTYAVTTPLLSTTALIVLSAAGSVGVAMAAVVAGDFGWFQIAGLNLVCKADTSAGTGLAYNGGTTGSIDDTVVVGDAIYGMFITVAESGNLAGVFLTYPVATNVSN